MPQQANRFAVKRLPDGRAMLNLACGTRMDPRWNNLDFSPYARLARRPWLARLMARAGLLSHQRRERLRGVDPDIIAWDLRKGIPFADNCFNVVYHSHFLEHLDRRHATAFLKECCRVLTSGGILRVVVPDLEILVHRYLKALGEASGGSPGAAKSHRQAVEDLFDQMVRQEATGATEQNWFVRRLERALRGGAASTGELHRWMYDRHSLVELFQEAGLCNAEACDCESSRVRDWKQFHLDSNADGSPYKPESLYVEGTRQL